MSIDELLTIIFRTFVYYVVIVFIFRMMGKREVGELSLLDMVVFIMIAELAVVTIEDLDMFFAYSMIPMAVLLIIQRLVAWFSLKSPFFRSWFEGKPSIIISQGKIDEFAMRKNRFNFEDLLQQLRENGTESINDVDYAILEPSGNLSIVEKSDKTNSISAKIDGLVMPLIVDGRVQEEALEQLNKDKQWLIDELNDRGYESIDTISLCSIDIHGEWFIDIKNEK